MRQHMTQSTIESTIRIAGTGLHTGRQITMTVKPAGLDNGIVFVRTDVPGNPSVPATVEHVVNVERCTVLGLDNVQIATVEHFLAACYGLSVDNLTVEIDSGEVPAMDGSARLFCDVLVNAGRRELGGERKVLCLKEPQVVGMGRSLLMALPSDRLRLTAIIDFAHPMVGTQLFEYDSEKDTFVDHIAPSRTFGFWEEVQALRDRNLAKGGSFDNALVVMPDGFSSPLRFPDELVRHKCLDLFGDMALVQRDMQVHFVSLRAGHALHVELMKKLRSLEVKYAGSRGDKEDSSSSLSILTRR